MSTVSDSPTRVRLYLRQGCHLCVDAERVVTEVCGVNWVRIDIDQPGAVTGQGYPAAEKYGELVPVVEVDGRRVSYWQIDADLLARALTPSDTA